MNVITFLLPNTNPSSTDVSKYRPKTCLTPIYKFFTDILANNIYKYVVEKSTTADEQKGFRNRSRWFKEQIVIHTILIRDAYKKRRKLVLAYIDSQMVYGSIPHSWLLKVLHLYRFVLLSLTSLTSRKLETELITRCRK